MEKRQLRHARVSESRGFGVVPQQTAAGQLSRVLRAEHGQGNGCGTMQMPITRAAARRARVGSALPPMLPRNFATGAATSSGSSTEVHETPRRKRSCHGLNIAESRPLGVCGTQKLQQSKAMKRPPLPAGLVDIYSAAADGRLEQHRPRRPQSALGCLEVFALPWQLADEDIRRSAEVVLHGAWSGDSKAQTAISHLMGLQLKGISLRSGKKTSRMAVLSRSREKDRHWLIWEEVVNSTDMLPAIDARAVGALVLRQQCSSDDGAMVIDYVAARSSCGAAGWPMVLAAEAICRKEGRNMLYSAADLTQDGCRAEFKPHEKPGKGGKSALDAHCRWGFTESSAEEWKAVGLELYDENRCDVRYMKKCLRPSGQASADTNH